MVIGGGGDWWWVGWDVVHWFCSCNTQNRLGEHCGLSLRRAPLLRAAARTQETAAQAAEPPRAPRAARCAPPPPPQRDLRPIHRPIALSPIAHLGRQARLLGLLGRLVDVVLDDLLERVDVDLLAHVAVLHERLLGVVAALHLDAQVHKLEHDVLVGLGPVGAAALGRDHVAQRLEGGRLLADILELLRALERVLGARAPATAPEARHRRLAVRLLGAVVLVGGRGGEQRGDVLSLSLRSLAGAAVLCLLLLHTKKLLLLPVLGCCAWCSCRESLSKQEVCGTTAIKSRTP